MPEPVIASVFRCAINWKTADGLQTATNVIHVSSETAGPTQIRDAFEDNTAIHQFDPVSGLWGVNTITIKPLDGTSAVYELALANWFGSGTNPFIPQGSAIVKHTTALGGRSHRGRTFLPGLAEEAQESGFLVGDTLTYFTDPTGPWQTWATDMATNDDVHLVVASYTLETASDVVLSVGEAPIATQRRRQSRNRA